MSAPGWLADSPASLLLFEDGALTGASRSACVELARALPELEGRGFVESLEPEDAAVFESAVKAAGVATGPGEAAATIVVRRVRVLDAGGTGPSIDMLQVRAAAVGGGVLVDVRDVTERHRLERLLGVAFTSVLVLDPTATIIWRTASHVARLESQDDDAEDVNALSMMHPDDLPGALDNFVRLLGKPGATDVRCYRGRREHDDAAWAPMRVKGINTLDEPLIGGVVIAVDADEGAQIEAINRTASGFHSLAASAPIGIVVTELTGRSLYCNDLAEALLGVTQARDGRTDWTSGMRPNDRLVVERIMTEALERQKGGSVTVTIDRPDGTEVWVRVDVLPQVGENGQPFGLIATLLDVTSENEARQSLQTAQIQLWQLANHDILTGLPNRMQFNDQLERAFVRHRRGGQALAVLFCDIDSFKPVNDTFGHHVGDAVLVEVARRLDTASREIDTVFRLGGDEFVIICEGSSGSDGLGRLAGRLIDAVGPPIGVGEATVTVGLSVGVALAGARPEATGESLLARADAALYRAKQLGRNRFMLAEDET
jgi:diguanylate cyclase (GGDEF)-like protein/PAS domain S-box-containing protein